MEFTKEHEGKIIFAIPTGNNARSNASKIYQFKVVKVKRKYVELAKIIDGVDLESTDNYCPNIGATQSAIQSGYGGNAGYKFFESEEEINRHYNKNAIKKELSDFFRYGFDLSYESCKEILDILKRDMVV